MNAVSPVNSSDWSLTQQLNSFKHPLENSDLLNQAAAKLGIDPTKLQQAFQEARNSGDKGTNLLTAVANKLGVQPDALQQAIQQGLQGTTHHRHHHHKGQSSDVASAPVDQNPTTQRVGNKIDVTA